METNDGRMMEGDRGGRVKMEGYWRDERRRMEGGQGKMEG